MDEATKGFPNEIMRVIGSRSEAEALAARINAFWRERGYDAQAKAFIRPPRKFSPAFDHKGRRLPTRIGAVWEVQSSFGPTGFPVKKIA